MARRKSLSQEPVIDAHNDTEDNTANPDNIDVTASTQVAGMDDAAGDATLLSSTEQSAADIEPILVVEAPKSNKGMLFVFLAALMASVMTIFIKSLNNRIPSFQVLVCRQLIILSVADLQLLRLGHQIWGQRKHRPMMVLRGCMGCIGLNCYIISIGTLPLSDAVVLSQTAPIFTAIFATIFLGETLSKPEIAVILISFCGVVLVSRPTFLPFSGSDANGPPDEFARPTLLGVCIATLGALGAASVAIVVRKLGPVEHPLVLVHYFAFVSTCITLPLMFLVPNQWPVLPQGWEFSQLAGVGTFGFFAQWLVNKGLQLDKAARTTSMNFVSVVLAFVAGLVLFGEQPHALSMVGGVLIMGGTVSIALLAGAKQQGAKIWARLDDQRCSVSAVTLCGLMTKGTSTNKRSNDISGKDGDVEMT